MAHTKMSGRIVELEDVKNSKFNQKKNIKTIALNGKNYLFKLTFKTDSGTEVSAIDLTGTLTWKALHGNILISNSTKSKGVILLRSNEFNVQNGNLSDQKLLDYITSALSIPTEDAKNVRPIAVKAEEPASQFTRQPTALQNEQSRLSTTNVDKDTARAKAEWQPTRQSIQQQPERIKSPHLNFQKQERYPSESNLPASNTIPKSRSRPFQMPVSASNTVQSLHSSNSSNPFVPNKSKPDQPSSFKQQYNKPITTHKRPLFSIINDVRLELRKKPKIENPNISPTNSPLPSSDDISTTNEDSDISDVSAIVDPSVADPIEEILSIEESVKFDDDDVADFHKISQQLTIDPIDHIPMPIEELDKFDLFFKEDVAAENQKTKIIPSSAPIVDEDSDVVLIEEKIHTTTKGMDLSSDVILIENSIYNTSFQDA